MANTMSAGRYRLNDYLPQAVSRFGLHLQQINHDSMSDAVHLTMWPRSKPSEQFTVRMQGNTVEELFKNLVVQLTLKGYTCS